jgi:hypothetical protein
MWLFAPKGTNAVEEPCSVIMHVRRMHLHFEADVDASVVNPASPVAGLAVHFALLAI